MDCELLAPCLWTGVVEVYDINAEGACLRALSHGQSLVGADPFWELGCRYTCYEAAISEVNSQFIMNVNFASCVKHPHSIDLHSFKEVFSGIGGMSFAAQFLGLKCLGSLDINPHAVSTMRANGATMVLQGDVLRPADRLRLHRASQVSRCVFGAGFPCQPLSTQGDGRGCADQRSEPFFALAKLFWEQQGGALLMECVPKAQTADYIQLTLQKLSHSMGMTMLQTQLHLHRAWPCRRSRWWCLIVPTPELPAQLVDLPVDSQLQNVNQLITFWPTWTLDEEEQLRVTSDEMEYYQDPQYGSDERLVLADSPCPCFLHSYGNFLTGCPCGCRQTSFHPDRLAAGGVRGFFTFGKAIQACRYLHPAEAALLCTFPTSMSLPSSLKLGLSQIGQCAAPLQAVWILAQWQQMTGMAAQGSAETTVISYKMCLMRDMHGSWPLHEDLEASIWDSQILSMRQINFVPGQTLQDLLDAEQRLAKDSLSRQLHDALGPLPTHHFLRHQAVVGSYALLTNQRRNHRCSDSEQIAYSIAKNRVPLGSGTACRGTFLFEIFAALDIQVFHKNIQDEHGNLWHADAVLTHPLVIVDFQFGGLGLATDAKGVSNLALDFVASTWISEAGHSTWLPIDWVMQFYLFGLQHGRGSFLTAPLHTTAYTCISLDGHWILLQLSTQGEMLIATLFDGLHGHLDGRLIGFLRRWAHLLGLTSWSVNSQILFEQTFSATCGAVAMQHLGFCLQRWTSIALPSELSLHRVFTALDLPGSWFGAGRLDGEPDHTVLLKLRDLLES